MKKSSFVLTVLRIAFILGLVGLFISFANILWVFCGHNFNWESARKFHSSIDFTNIWRHDKVAFNVISILEIASIIVKILFFLIVLRILKHLNFTNPFNNVLVGMLKKISVLAFFIGILGIVVKIFIEAKVSNDLLLSTQIGNSEYLWTGAILFLVYTVFQRGHELQSENDLTI